MITDQSSYYDFDIKDGKWVYRFKNSNTWRQIGDNDFSLKLTKLASTMPEYKDNPIVLMYVTHQKDVENRMQLLPEQKPFILGEEILKKAEEGKLATPKNQNTTTSKKQDTPTFIPPKSPQEWSYSLLPKDDKKQEQPKKATEIIIPVETTDTIPKYNIKKFVYDTVWTPGVRDTTDLTYKQGHGLTNQQKAIVLHHTGSDYERSRNWLTDPSRKASAHVLINRDGSVTVLATPDQVTFHAGRSSWKGVEDVNDYGIGIEFVGDTNKQDLTPDQIQSAVQYMIPIIEANNIPADMIVSHAMISKEYGDRHSGKGTGKVDINEANYNKVMAALNEQYYNKKKVAQHQQGGAVGTNRTYAQTIKENLQSLYEKLKTNTFVNLLFPLEEVSNGNTLAAIPYLIPAGGAVKTTAKLLTGKQPLQLTSGQSSIKRLPPIQAFQDETSTAIQKVTKPLMDIDYSYQLKGMTTPQVYLRAIAAGDQHNYPETVKKMMTNSVAPRMAFFRQENITDMSDEIRKVMGNTYYELPGYAFSGNVVGDYWPVTNRITIQKGHVDFALPHEIRHKIDYGIPLTNEEYNYLEKAYGKTFNFANQQASDPTHEWVTTNFDARRKLLGDNALQYLPVKVQNQKIDAMSANQIIDALRMANGYGERFVKALGESAYDPKQIKALKNAMKYVGAAATPVGLNYFDIMNNDGRNNNQNPQ